MLLSSVINSTLANINALTASEAGEPNAYDAGLPEHFLSLEGKEKLQLGKKATAVDKPKLTKRIETQVAKGVGKTKEIVAKAKAKVSAGITKSKDFIVRNYDKAKVKTQSTWEKIKSWFTGTKNSDVKA